MIFKDRDNDYWIIKSKEEVSFNSKGQTMNVWSLRLSHSENVIKDRYKPIVPVLPREFLD